MFVMVSPVDIVMDQQTVAECVAVCFIVLR